MSMQTRVDEREITELCFVAEALIAAPEQAADILNHTLAGLPPSGFSKAIKAIQSALKHCGDITAVAQTLLSASAPAAIAAGQALKWAETNQHSRASRDARRARGQARF